MKTQSRYLDSQLYLCVTNYCNALIHAYWEGNFQQSKVGLGLCLNMARQNNLQKMASNTLLGLSYLYCRIEGMSENTQTFIQSAKTLAIRINDITLALAAHNVDPNIAKANDSNDMVLVQQNYNAEIQCVLVDSRLKALQNYMVS